MIISIATKSANNVFQAPLRLFAAAKSELTEDNGVFRHYPEGALEKYYLQILYHKIPY